MIALTLTGLWVLCSFIVFLMIVSVYINEDYWVDFGDPAEGWPAFAWGALCVASGPIALWLIIYALVMDWFELKFG